MESSSKEPKTRSTDEIDLFELLARGALTIKKNFVIIIITFIIGTALGLVSYQISPRVYESKMLINSDILTESYSKALIDNLNKLIRERNIQSLSMKLSLPMEIASKITEIEIKSALEKASDTPENNKVYLTIQVRTLDNTIWPVLQNGLTEYLRGNEFVKIRVEQRKKYLTQIIEKINQELLDLESLKARMQGEDLAQSKGNLVLFDPTSVNSKIIDLNKEKINSQNGLETVNSVQVVDGFTVFKKPIGPKLLISLAGGASIGLIFVTILITFKAIRAMLKFSIEKLGKD